MDSKRTYLGLDVGEQRTGVAVGDSIGRIAQPFQTVSSRYLGELIHRILQEYDITDIVIGQPRNQSGEFTAQTAVVRKMAKVYLEHLGLPLHWQDESLTSVIAEERLQARTKPYTKEDIDAEAATIILQDYLDQL
jgi:putative Holliday junction resolvase